MPELPEVETVRRGLEKLILGKKISSIEIRYPKMIKTDLDEFQKEVPGQVVESMGRRGKYLLFYLTDKVLISHLRMRVSIFTIQTRFLNASMLMFFSSLRMVVRLFMRMYASLEQWNSWRLPFWMPTLFLKKLGPEPSEQDFDLQVFQTALAKSKKPIKSHLLDQTLVVGLGNIYVDEVLWRGSGTSSETFPDFDSRRSDCHS